MNHCIAALCTVVIASTGLTLTLSSREKKDFPALPAVTLTPVVYFDVPEATESEKRIVTETPASDDAPMTTEPQAAVQQPYYVEQPAAGDYSTRRVRRFAILPRNRGRVSSEPAAGCAPLSYTFVQQPPSTATVAQPPPVTTVNPPTVAAVAAQPPMTYQFAPFAASSCPNGVCQPARRFRR